MNGRVCLFRWNKKILNLFIDAKGGKKVETIEKIIGGNSSDCNGDDDPGNDSGQCGKHIYKMCIRDSYRAYPNQSERQLYPCRRSKI